MQPSLRRLAVAGVVAASLVLATASGSSATSSIAVSGIALPTGATLTTRVADGNVLIDGSGTHAWTGSFTGTSEVEVHFVIHSSGSITFQGLGTFTGSTPCGAGTFRLNAAGSGPFPGPVIGHGATVDQADASISMHANLDIVLFLTPAGAVFTYSGDARCG